jgi:FkbM family methyltransferase
MLRFLKTGINYYKLRTHARHFAALPSPTQLELVIEWLYFLARPNIKVVYDVGAADGSFSAACSKLANIEAVVAFEPGAKALTRLNKLSLSATKITVNPVALGARSGTQSFYMTEDAHSSSLLLPRETLEELYPGRGSVEKQTLVEVGTLDSTIARFQLPPPDVIKLDTQGYELEILSRAESALASASFCIVECCYEQLYAGAPLVGDVFAFFSDLGWLNVSTAPVSRSALGKPVYTDLLFASPKAGIQ